VSRVALGVLVLGASLALAGCYQVASYKGDGKLVDYGWQNYSQRYVLDLGPIDLSSAGSYSYELSNLPHAEFTIGIAIVEAQPNELNGPRPDHSGYVRVELKAEDGQTIVLEDGPLQNWTHSYALRSPHSYLYRRGEQRDIPLPGGGARIELLRNSAGGWGSYFIAQEHKSYTLTFEVLKPNPAIRPARLSLHGVDTP